MIERTFKNIQGDDLNNADQQSFLVNLGWASNVTWKDLLRSKRVLIISEAGAGKTYECRKLAQRLWDAGEPAFFLELAQLASTDLRSMLDNEEETRLDAWLSSQSDVATFFLDSIDELKLSVGSFELALTRLKKGIGNQLGRARLIITTRPIAFDERLVRRLLPIPPEPSTESREEIFAKIAMCEHKNQHNNTENKDKEATVDWRTVALMPLSDTQIVEFALVQGIKEPEVLLRDLQKRNAQEFARRPQDLIELCADWRNHTRIRTHRDQVATNVHIKLQPRNDRPELAELSTDMAIEGASRLALAMQVTRRLTIKHSTASDIIEDEIALDPTVILSDWKPNERKTLLERPLFGFASYGRVRFHHRSVSEYLAAERLRSLREGGMSTRTLKRLLFSETKGKTIVRPSKRPVAGWLALTDAGIFEMLRDHEPAVLLNEGDPESLTKKQRNQALRAYVEHYGRGGWRGLSIPHIQIHRFASPELAKEINHLWDRGIDNAEVRQTLLNLIGMGLINECADIAHVVTFDPTRSKLERIIALDAMVSLNHPSLKDIACAVTAGDELWPNEIVSSVILRMFPRNLSIDQLCQALNWVKEEKRSVGDLSWQMARLIEDTEFDLPSLNALRNGLVELVSCGLSWRKDSPHIISNRQHLSSVLAATCTRGLVVSKGKDPDWYHASVLALRLHDRKYCNDEAHKSLLKHLTGLNTEENALLFWAEDSLVQSLHSITDPKKRLAEVVFMSSSSVVLRANRDLIWIKDALADTTRTASDRAMLLEAAIGLPLNCENWPNHLSTLRHLVADLPKLLTIINERCKPSQHDKQQKCWEKKEADRKKQIERRDAKYRASWILLWREIAKDPKKVFSSEHSSHTVCNLWQVMRHDGENSRTSGWNRRFIEDYFGKETADLLRLALMNTWREDRPTLASERPKNERSTYLVRWQLGLAALYAEAEDPSWATKLTDEQAKLAVRYAPIELNKLPSWLESLVSAHPSAVNAILGNELSWELEQLDADDHSMLLQSINYENESVIKLFIPRLWDWLNTNNGDCVDNENTSIEAPKRLQQVIDAILKHYDDEERERLLVISQQNLQGDLPDEHLVVWLPTLMRINPALGVDALESQIKTVAPEKYSKAVRWFSLLFGDRQNGINLRNAAFTPRLLLRLLRLAYRHVRPDHDAKHNDIYTPDLRDDAEHARNAIVSALLDAKGEEGWAAKIEMAEDPLCAHFKDRIITVAEEHWAQEIDSIALDEAQAVALDKKGEAPASTNEAMFAIMSDRLADLDDLLLRDTSPREAWAGIDSERVLRREIARELNHIAKGLYNVDQEAVTADEKETDIRLRSVVSDHEAVIELKLADNRSANDLRDTIYNQLVKKYMAAENSQSGCLLVTLAKDRMWVHPEKNKHIDLTELTELLRSEAKRVEEVMSGSVAIAVHILDLRPRLPKENQHGI